MRQMVQKEVYETPVLVKHALLRDITASSSDGSVRITGSISGGLCVSGGPKRSGMRGRAAGTLGYWDHLPITLLLIP